MPELGMFALQDWVERSRIKRGLTQDQLAEKAGLSRAMINRIETGRVVKVSPLTLTRLVSALKLQPPKELVDEAVADRRRKRDRPSKKNDDEDEIDLWEIWAEQARERLRAEREAADAAKEDDFEIHLGRPFDLTIVPINDLGNETNGAIGEQLPPGELPDEIPLLADVRGGLPDGGVYDGTVEAQLPVRHLYGIKDRQAFALRVVGDSMAPRIPEGAIVFIAPNEERFDGEPCFVQFGGERDYMATIKNVFDAGADWILMANNQNFEPNTERVPKSEVLRVLPVVWYAVSTR